jgi:hypothetical protein
LLPGTFVLVKPVSFFTCSEPTGVFEITKPTSVLVVTEEELIGAPLAAEGPAIVPLATVVADPLEADGALVESALEFALVAAEAVHRREEVEREYSTRPFTSAQRRVAVFRRLSLAALSIRME